MSEKIGIIDAELGNLRSVSNAVYTLGYDFELVSTPKQVGDDLSRLIIPGVGSFPTAMENLRSRQLRGPIRRFAASGRPVLGICLGMQILASVGFELEESEGLDLIPGRVVRLTEREGFKIPHVGWNTVTINQKHPIFEGIKNNRDFYFVHSYHFCPAKDETVLGRTVDGSDFCSAVASRNVIGVQFHPEKSQSNGLKVLENFCEWDGRC